MLSTLVLSNENLLLAFARGSPHLFWWGRMSQSNFTSIPLIFSPIFISVKSQNGKMKSMKTLIASDRYEDISFGIKLKHGNIGYDSDVYTFPYSCSFLVKSFLKQTF